MNSSMEKIDPQGDHEALKNFEPGCSVSFRGKTYRVQRRTTLASRLGALGMSAPAVIGVRFGLEPGRGRTAVPVRTAIA